MWSCGVVTYILLGGYAPFEGKLEELALKILKGNYEFHDEYWSSISRGAKDLVSSLLQVNPDVRITAEEALQNEWMTADEETLTIKDLSMAQKGMRASLPVDKLRGAVKAIVAANKLTSLGDSFKSVLDTGGPIKRNTDGERFGEKSLPNLNFDFELDEEDSSSGKPFKELYILGKELGAGAFSTVFDGTHSQSENQYAVKCVRRHDLHQSDAVALQDEIEALKVLKDCPYIVRIHDVFDEPDYSYVVLERMEGGDLIDRIIEKAHYTEVDAREVCKQLLLGVQFCHANKIANRNLKPENLLLVSKTSDTDVKISDFGYAKKVLYPNSLRTQCGTEGYVAPEILEHRPAYDVHCDMWSLGVIIYIVLGGYRPFRGSQDEVMKQIRYGEYEFHERYWGHVSQDAKNMIAGMLTVDPEKRISAAEALNNAWITADKNSLGQTDLKENQEQLKDFKPKAKMRQVVKFVSTSFQK
jgi:calcium/calmodulin-dependent protein kinase I